MATGDRLSNSMHKISNISKEKRPRKPFATIYDTAAPWKMECIFLSPTNLLYEIEICYSLYRRRTSNKYLY